MQQQQQKLERNSTNGEGNAVIAAAAISPPAFTSPDRQVHSPLHYFPDDSTFLNLYSSIFSPTSAPLQPTFPTPASLSLTPSSLSDEDTVSSTDHRLYLARLTLQYREMEDRYELCLSHLQDTVEEVEALRHEISRLRKANTDLAKQLNPTRKQQTNISGLAFPTPLSLVNDLRRLNFDEPNVDSSPTSVLRHDQVPQTQRVSLPKSISVRSNGFLKANSSTSGRRVSTPALLGSQRVYVPGKGKVGEQEEEEEEPVEFEVYGQGMCKTELCNKWEETGACPYGDHCQFAHGIGELRPVIRHPRYKTEVCRMVLAGGACPYGHRCHFRHALTPHDRGFLGPAGTLS